MGSVRYSCVEAYLAYVTTCVVQIAETVPREGVMHRQAGNVQNAEVLQLLLVYIPCQ